MFSGGGPPEGRMKCVVGYQMPGLSGVTRCSLTWVAKQGHLLDGIRAIRAAP